MNEYLGQKVKVIIDRPLASIHPRYQLYYPINYGYLPDTLALDQEPIDAYVIGEFEPLNTFEGYVVAIIFRKNDIEYKLVVCKEKQKYTKDQIEALVEFQERFFDSHIIL